MTVSVWDGSMIYSCTLRVESRWISYNSNESIPRIVTVLLSLTDRVIYWYTVFSSLLDLIILIDLTMSLEDFLNMT